jgi:hypothetical protein
VRSQLIGRCTCSTLARQTTHDVRHAAQRIEAAYAYNITLGYTRAWSCIEELSRVLQAASVVVDTQPRELIVPRLGNETMYRGPGEDKHAPPLAGIRAAAHAVAAASRRRREHCATFGCAPYDYVVRLRPDLYMQAGPESRRVGSNQSPWVKAAVPVADVWKLMVAHHDGASTSDSAGSAARPAVYACTREIVGAPNRHARQHLGRPGDKSYDNCFWGAADVMDRLADAADALALPFLEYNRCYGRWAARSRQSSEQTAVQPPPTAVCGAQFAVNCTAQEFGCVAEDLLRLAIEGIGAEARRLPQAPRPHLY